MGGPRGVMGEEGWGGGGERGDRDDGNSGLIENICSVQDGLSRGA